MNFLKMTNRVRFTLGLEDVSINDEVALAKEWLNEGVLDVLTRTRAGARIINLIASANTPVHDMSQQVIALFGLASPSGVSLDRLSVEDIGIAQAGGARGYAYKEPMLWISPVGSEMETYRAYGVFRPAPLVADTDDAALPNFGALSPEFHPAVVNYALWKAGEYLQHEQSGGGEKWRIAYEGQDGAGGDIARIKRILAKRVTPQGGLRRDLSHNLGSLSRSGDFIRA